MWYEILPAFMIITGALAFSAGGSALFNKIVLGNFYRRSLHSQNERLNYLRDRRLDKYMNPYNVHGLETLDHHHHEDGTVADEGDDDVVATDVDREACPADFKDRKDTSGEEVESGDVAEAKKDEN